MAAARLLKRHKFVTIHLWGIAGQWNEDTTVTKLLCVDVDAVVVEYSWWLCRLLLCSVHSKAAANDFHLTSTCAHTCAFTPATGLTSVHLTAVRRSLHSQQTSSRIFWRTPSTSTMQFW